jgi:transcriptional regulator with XRE-family HTH domain
MTDREHPSQLRQRLGTPTHEVDPVVGALHLVPQGKALAFGRRRVQAVSGELPPMTRTSAGSWPRAAQRPRGKSDTSEKRSGTTTGPSGGDRVRTIQAVGRPSGDVLAADTTTWLAERWSLVDPLDSALFDSDEVRAALAARDVGTVYRLLWRAGVSQRRIGQLTGQSQSEVCEILKGRRVRDVWVLERIADGLGVPRAWMGLGYGEEGSDAPSAEEDVDEEMRRRALFAAVSAATLGQVLRGVGEPVEVALSAGQELPSRLGMCHVQAVRAVTDRLHSVACHCGGQAELVGAAATLYTRWMQVPATEVIKARLAAALAELHTQAGYCCYDSGVDGTGYFIRALRLAREAADAYSIANAAENAGATLVRNGHPNDALKFFQLGQLHLTSGFGKSAPVTPRAEDPRLPTLTARLSRQCATAYAVMDGPDETTRCLAEAYEGWAPRDAVERAGGDSTTAAIQLDLAGWRLLSSSPPARYAATARATA